MNSDQVVKVAVGGGVIASLVAVNIVLWTLPDASEGAKTPYEECTALARSRELESKLCDEWSGSPYAGEKTQEPMSTEPTDTALDSVRVTYPDGTVLTWPPLQRLLFEECGPILREGGGTAEADAEFRTCVDALVQERRDLLRKGTT